MLSCFSSSREKIRISLISVAKKRSKTALPKDPVPPVIISVFPINIDIALYFPSFFILCQIRVDIKSKPFIIFSPIISLLSYQHPQMQSVLFSPTEIFLNQFRPDLSYTLLVLSIYFVIFI